MCNSSTHIQGYIQWLNILWLFHLWLLPQSRSADAFSLITKAAYMILFI